MIIVINVVGQRRLLFSNILILFSTFYLYQKSVKYIYLLNNEMKMVKSMIGKWVRRMRYQGKGSDDNNNPVSISILNERMNGLEKKLNDTSTLPQMLTTAKNTRPTDKYIDLELMLKDEIRSRERLERKLTKTSRKMDRLEVEFNFLHTQLNVSTVDLDLERRKNAELRKRLTNHPIRNDRKIRKLDQ